ncbi:serine threonine- kinase [Chlorella sorokiniana]|uniref:Serine threonine-kinase n=1 Tax=Chlorella sorokiniana TaxID=3076 RepID=A0A2P6TIW8_CHLSO|nr:serine threonine- kinase [Chlorella sorokiniana]|eukprot:PRW39194.1 serine threonine- kinase [Chlorella sorokiniana]
MRSYRRCALLGLVFVAVAAAAVDIAAPTDGAAPLEPSGGYLAPGGAPSGSQTLFSPWHLWSTEAEQVLQNVAAVSQEDCAELCWQDPDCLLFDYRLCASEAGAAGCAGAPSNTCRMFGMGCGSVIPLATPVQSDSGDTRWAAAGFPMRYDVQDGGRFEVQPGRGLVGGDLTCNGTLVPGMCAVAEYRQVSILCGNWSDCDAIVHYYAGLDGCSSPLFVLKSSRLASSGYLAPSVATLTKLDQSVRLSRMVKAADGNFTLPSPEELAAATSGVDQNGTASDRPWLGCFSGPGLLPAGNVVGVVDGAPDADACCRACRQDAACNVWAWCPNPVGCNYTHDQRTFQFAGGQCELRFNELASADHAFPLTALSKGGSVPFVGGAPLAVAVLQPPIDGFTAVPGVTQYGNRLTCDGSLRPDIGECVLPGTAQELVDICQSMPNCCAVAFMPEGGIDLAPGQPIGLLKSNVTQSGWALNLYTVLLVVPELREHIAHCDAAISYGRRLAAPGSSGNASLPLQPSLLSSGELPATLQDWVVDIHDIELLRAPNGAPMELGSGATATVFKAKLRGETIAAKEMDLGRSHEVQQLFVQEAERLHQLRHSHVVALYGVSLSGANGYLLMEYCAGRDLAACLGLKVAGSSRRLFSWYYKGRNVAANIAAAVNFLHSRAIVHFDIKASNVLLTATGAAKLADVGVARLQAGTHLSYTPVVGTFAWMAPEVITGARCSEKVDVFSYGVLLWEICTGERPRRGDMRTPRVPEECPQEVVDLIGQCMSLDPQDRPSAQHLLARLEELGSRGDRSGKQHAGGAE